MPTYQFTITAEDGKTRRQSIKAASFGAAALELRNERVDFQGLKEKPSILAMELTKSKIKKKELLHISRQLAAFIRAGIPILDAFNELAEEADSRAAKRALSQIASDIRTGSTLTEAVNRHPGDFPEYYRAILASSELTGDLDSILMQLADYLEQDIETRAKITGAMIYPAVITGLSFVTIIVMTVFVLPQFQKFFESLNVELPLPTRMLMAFTGFLTSKGLYLLAGLVVFIIVYLILMRVRPVRRIRDRMLLRVPVIGPLIRYAMVERYTRLLASMIDAGIPLPRAMTVAISSLKNVLFVDLLTEARERTMAGDGITVPLRETGLLPSMAVRMIRVGEETGTLDQQLLVAADYYKSELDYRLKRATDLIEPTVLVVMGGIVGFIAVALVSAMYGVFGSTELQGQGPQTTQPGQVTAQIGLFAPH